jgi:rhamnosyltransferase
MDFFTANGLNWMSSCSVVIRAYNEAAHIGRLLEGLSWQTLRDQEIILVDSGSTDATVEQAAQAGAKVVHIPPEEFTFGRSLNLGMAAATHELVVIASAHVYPIYPDWLERLLEPFSDPQVALAYGKQRAPASAHFSEKQVYQRWYPETSDLHQAQPFCNNANAAVRLSAWREHSYDESLTGLEDLAWARWVLSAGHRLAYIAEAEVVHTHHESCRGVYNRYRREGMAFKRIYPEAHFSLYDFVRMTSANVTSDLWHAWKQKTFLGKAAGIFWYRIAQFWGTYQGYRRSLEWNWNLRQTFYYPHGMEMPGQLTPRRVEPIRYKE